MSRSDLTGISAAGLGRAYRAGAIDPVAAVEWFLDRIEHAADPAVFIAITGERARREAQASALRYRNGAALGLLDGVPVAWKDLFAVEDTVTTAGSEIFRNAPRAPANAVAVQMLAQAGMVTVGKVNLTEFAYSALGLNPHFGTPANPRDTTVRRAPGGSSSGSAVAVASGLVPCAIGTDTGGSVRIPAAFNGIVGFKTGEGEIDSRGVFALSPTLDTIGPLARTVEDCILLYAVLRGVRPDHARFAAPAELTFVIPKNYVFDEVEDAVAANFHRAAAALEKSGARLVEKTIPLLDEIHRLTQEHGTITAAEAYFRHRELVEGPQRGLIDPRVTPRILRGKEMSAYDLLFLRDARIRLRRKMLAELDGALLLMPTVPLTAPPLAPLEADPNLFHAVNLKTLRNTMIGNFLDLCGVAMPSGVDAQNLPTSILVSAPAGAEAQLFGACLAVERILASA
jgi:aspartyl-tRNA(Asn)/glutamyl-tRNA(Gln) amidotransferase subunit A